MLWLVVQRNNALKRKWAVGAGGGGACQDYSIVSLQLSPLFPMLANWQEDENNKDAMLCAI